MTSQSGSRERRLADLLLRRELSSAAVPDAVEAGLAGYALDTVGDGSTHDAGLLRSSRLVTAARHIALRRATLELVRAWHEVGIETLLFKGFYLAEFVYPDASWRTYSDVDLALRSRSVTQPADLAGLAAQVARSVGFAVVWRLGERERVGSFHDPEYNGHELLQLVHVDSGAYVDAHRRLVHSNVTRRPQSSKGEVLTSQVWDAARPVDFGGVPVYVPAAVDSALVGLMVARSWSGDRHALRPHDYLDLDLLMQHGRFGHRELMARARELGLTATARLFLLRCDPAARRLDLRAPGRARAFVYDALLVGERSHRALARAGAALSTAPAQALHVVRELPSVARQAARVRAGHRPRWSTFGLPADPPVLDRRVWRATQVGVRRALKLTGVRPESQPELALACLYGSVRRRGYDVERFEAGGRTWFEYRGQVLPVGQLGLAAASGGGEGPPGGPVGGTTAWRRLRAMGWSGVWLRLEALVLLRRILSSLGPKPFRAVREELLPDGARAATARRGHGARQRPASSGSAPVGRAVESAARFVPGALCVAQALAGQVMLARRDRPSTIHFGFLRTPAGSVEGHAWLEVDGIVVVGDGPLENFTRTATFEA